MGRPGVALDLGRKDMGKKSLMPSVRGGSEGLLGQCVGPYRLEAVLGEGQMGVVYRAVRVGSGETVALKVLRRELSADDVFRRRFEREADVASVLRHDHIVRVVDCRRAADWQYVASEYVHGRSLDERLAAEGPLPVTELVRVIAHVGGALDALHRLGLVHRDVKPSNVLVDEHGRALLTDFGVARGDAHTTLTRVGRTVGTPDYLAPEVIRGERAGPRADIYGLGCLAYECAAGSPPFAAKTTIGEVCAAHLQEAPPDPSHVRELPVGFADALLTALIKDPERRPATGTAYARLLRASAKSG
jgi:serine/threonine protein kinase